MDVVVSIKVSNQTKFSTIVYSTSIGQETNVFYFLFLFFNDGFQWIIGMNRKKSPNLQGLLYGPIWNNPFIHDVYF